MWHENLTNCAPFELWRDDGKLHLRLNPSVELGVRELKEILRLINALDPGNTRPVLIHSVSGNGISDEAEALLQRSCRGRIRRFVACVGMRIPARDRLRHIMERSSFPFRVFSSDTDADMWFQRAIVH